MWTMLFAATATLSLALIAGAFALQADEEATKERC